MQGELEENYACGSCGIGQRISSFCPRRIGLGDAERQALATKLAALPDELQPNPHNPDACPRLRCETLTPEVALWIEDHRLWRRGVMKYRGAPVDQPARWVAAMRHLDSIGFGLRKKDVPEL